MKTTLGEIMKHDPCGQTKGSGIGWDKLVSFLGTDDLDTEVTFRQILKSNGIEDTVWALRTQPYRDYCLFCAEVSESVLHFFEKEYPKDDRPRKAIEGIRRYHSGETSLYELKELESDAMDAVRVAARAERDAFSAARDAARAAARAAASDAARAARAARAAACITRDTAWTVTNAYAWGASWDLKWQYIEKILLKYI